MVDRNDTSRIDKLEERIKLLEQGALLNGESHLPIQSLLNTIFQHAGDAICFINTKGILVSVYNRVKDIFGYNPEGVIGRHISEIDFSVESDLKYEVIRSLDYPEQDWSIDKIQTYIRFKARHKNGGIIHFETSVERVESNAKLEGWVAIIRKLTESEYVERLKDEYENRYRILLDASRDSIVLIDNQGRIIDTNKVFAGFMNRSVKDLIGMHISDLNLIWADIQKLVAGMAKVVKTGKMYQVETAYEAESTIWVRNTLYPIKTTGGIVSSVAIFSHDITEMKESEQQLRKNHDKLDELVKSRTNDLKAAKTALQVLLKKRDTDKEELEKKILHNIMETVLPLLDKVKSSKMDERDSKYLELVEENLRDIVSPFSRKLTSRLFKLTPSELEVANLIKFGRSTKEISEMSNLSLNTIQFYRSNISE